MQISDAMAGHEDYRMQGAELKQTDQGFAERFDYPKSTVQTLFGSVLVEKG